MFNLRFGSGTQLTSPAERRRMQRESALLPAFIKLNGHSFPCTTVNLSSAGARLHLSPTRIIPGTFEVHIPSRNFAAKARLAWRNGDDLGVEFID